MANRANGVGCYLWETGGSLGMGDEADAIEIEAADLRDFQPEAEPQGHPVAKGFAEFALAAGQGLRDSANNNSPST